MEPQYCCNRFIEMIISLFDFNLLIMIDDCLSFHWSQRICSICIGVVVRIYDNCLSLEKTYEEWKQGQHSNVRFTKYAVFFSD